MLTSIALFLTFPLATETRGPALLPVPATRTFEALAAQQKDDEYAKRKKEAGKDIAKLWKLHEWCKEQKKDKEAKAALKEIVKIDPLHKEANIALGNLFFDGKWFESQAKIEEYKKQKVVDEKHAQGLVEYKGEWVPKEDVPFLEKGLVKDDYGNWISGDEAKKLKEGYVKQDLTWIPPAEKENIGKDLWKCGDKWLSLADANMYHAELYQEWRVPFSRFVVWTTHERDLLTQKLKVQLEGAMDDLERIYGAKPKVAIPVCILRNLEQYNRYAAGDEEEQRQGTEMLGLSSAYHAYLADILFDEDGTSTNMGVSYWDASTDEGNKRGVHNIRHALGQSYAEAIDPSPEALAMYMKNNRIDNAFAKKFYSEKRIPPWFRYGAATYVERYYVERGVKNPTWTRTWSLENLLRAGGLRPLKQVLECRVKPADPADTAKLFNETGLVMAFVMDGKCEPVVEKHKAFQEALKTAKDRKTIDDAAKALEAEVLKNETELRKFAGL